jgi:hypothetical protein
VPETNDSEVRVPRALSMGAFDYSDFRHGFAFSKSFGQAYPSQPEVKKPEKQLLRCCMATGTRWARRNIRSRRLFGSVDIARDTDRSDQL